MALDYENDVGIVSRGVGPSTLLSQLLELVSDLTLGQGSSSWVTSRAHAVYATETARVPDHHNASVRPLVNKSQSQQSRGESFSRGGNGWPPPHSQSINNHSNDVQQQRELPHSRDSSNDYVARPHPPPRQNFNDVRRLPPIAPNAPDFRALHYE